MVNRAFYNLNEKARRNSLWAAQSPELPELTEWGLFRTGRMSVLFTVLTPHLDQCQAHTGPLTGSQRVVVGY